MTDDPQRSRRAGRLGWLAIGVFIVFWSAPICFVIAYPPKGQPAHGEMALIGVAIVIMFIGAVGLTGTAISIALAIWGLCLKRRSVVSSVALGLDIVAIVAALIGYFKLR